MEDVSDRSEAFMSKGPDMVVITGDSAPDSIPLPAVEPSSGSSRGGDANGAPTAGAAAAVGEAAW